MVLAVRRDARLRIDGFLAMLEAAPEGDRWELIDGEALLMSPPSERHRQITADLIRRSGATWAFVSAGLDGTIDLPEPAASLPVSAIDAGLDP
ncbi:MULTISPECIES: Uma2 family endonuclease [Methylobacterium]|uniref:Uma2 family endonuclease n=1 Tax=Methylobacterium TaxID=407 RepID=UPI001052869F|nr:MULTISPECIES: Uma2 family endonuclease [Methylobacterium]MDR7036799.1 Uma2 family endonuclease [Methylobacterium sp. BE186]